MHQRTTTPEIMWNVFKKEIGRDGTYEAWHFCDNEKDANELAILIKQGIKQATVSLKRSYDIEREALPKPGDFNRITDWEGHAICMIETKKIEVVSFNEVTIGFAEIKGKATSHWLMGKPFTRLPFLGSLQVMAKVFQKI